MGKKIFLIGMVFLLLLPLLSAFDSGIHLKHGWNLISARTEPKDDLSDRKIPLEKGWNLIGYSANKPYNWSDILVTDGSIIIKIENAGTWLQPIIYYFENGSFRFVPGDDSFLRKDKGYWIYAEKNNLQLILPKAGGSFPKKSFQWSEAKIRKGNEVKSIGEAEQGGWLQSTIYYFDNKRQKYGLVPDDKGTVHAWEGYWIWSNEELMLLFGNLTDPIFLDFDADGISNDIDNCPRLPNPDQERLCDNSRDQNKGDYVFLRSRTFKPAEGVEEGLLPPGPSEQRIHVFLYIQPGRNIVLTESERAILNQSQVTLLSYISHFAYYASLPIANVESISKFPFIKGIGKILPEDKIDLDIRLREAVSNEVNLDGTANITVIFFEDVSKVTMDQVIAGKNITAIYMGDEYFKAIVSFNDILQLAEEDTIKSISEAPRSGVSDLDSSLPAIHVDTVHTKYGFTGEGYTASVQENGDNPYDHPDFADRMVILNRKGARGHHGTLVAGVLVGDGNLSNGTIRGVMYNAKTLVSMAHNYFDTPKVNAYRRPMEAMDDYGAIFNSNSWSHNYDCDKAGAYIDLAKWFDTSVYYGLPILKSSGNGRGPGGDYFNLSGCEKDLYSLGPPVGKNMISVGSVSDYYYIAGDSSAGPSADERLKPDIVAIGVNVNTSRSKGGYRYGEVSGTSISTPMAAGVLGLMVEAFDYFHGEKPQPETLKAIMIHTAKDLSTEGPDYYYGYGVVMADAAIDLIKSAETLVVEDGKYSSDGPKEYPFEILPNTKEFKVTMAYTDYPGEYSSSKTLINDLDLILIGPANITYYPWYTYLHGDDKNLAASYGAQRCPFSKNYSYLNKTKLWEANFTNTSELFYMETVVKQGDECLDDRNNVEQVSLVPADGKQYLTPGTWTAKVTTNRMETYYQSYSLVFDPKCPLIITNTTTLLGDISCAYNSSAEGVAVLVTGSDLTLDCANYSIVGSGYHPGNQTEYIGILVEGSNVEIRNCNISGFDIGIQNADTPYVTIYDSALSDMQSYGVNLNNNYHDIINITILNIKKSGIRLEGLGNDIKETSFSEINEHGISMIGNLNYVSNSIFSNTDLSSIYASGDYIQIENNILNEVDVGVYTIGSSNIIRNNDM